MKGRKRPTPLKRGKQTACTEEGRVFWRGRRSPGNFAGGSKDCHVLSAVRRGPATREPPVGGSCTPVLSAPPTRHGTRRHLASHGPKGQRSPSRPRDPRRWMRRRRKHPQIAKVCTRWMLLCLTVRFRAGISHKQEKGKRRTRAGVQPTRGDSCNPRPDTSRGGTTEQNIPPIF